MNPSCWLKINVGGQVFETSLKTVTKYPNSKLASMFKTEREMFTIDLEPQYFSVILSWLRYLTFTKFIFIFLWGKCLNLYF